MHRSRIIKVILMTTICLVLSGSANATLTVEVWATDTTFSMTLNGQADVEQLGALYKDRLIVGFGGNWCFGCGPNTWLTGSSIVLSENLPGGTVLTGSAASVSWLQAYHSGSVESVTFNNHTYSWTVADPSQAPNDLADFGLHLGFNNSGVSGGIPGTESFGPVISATVVPEPTTALLVGLGLIGLGVRRRLN